MRSFTLLLLVTAVLFTHFPANGAVSDANFTETNAFTSGSFLEFTGMAWAPDGSNRLFLIRKSGQIRILKNGVLLPTPFATETVHTNSECGLIGMAFDPGFVTNGFVYFFITASSSEQQIVRYKAVGDTGTERTVIVPGLPTVGQNHDGGGIGFGPDGMLYWSIGDLGNGTGVDADLTSLAAKVGRAHRDGSVPTDNPFYDGAGPNNDYIWARGFRNPFTMTLQPETEQLWVNVAGTLYEQVFVVAGGDHAGYNDYENNQPAGFLPPVIAYRTNGTNTFTISSVTRSAGVATFTVTSTHNLRLGAKVMISGVSDTSFNGTAYVSATPSATTFSIAQALPNATSSGGTAETDNLGGAITGGTFFESTSVPSSYRGDFFFTDYNSGRVVRANISGGQIASVDTFATGQNQAIDADVGPDGNLYVVRINGTISRYAYNASAQGLVVSRRFLRISEGSVAAFNVRLAVAPSSNITVTVSHASGDSDLFVSQGSSMTFTPSNWSTPQTVNITAPYSADTSDHAATFALSSAGLASEDVVVRATSSSTVPLSSPSNLEAVAASPTTVSLNWNSVPGATQYDIQRKSAGGDFQHLTSVASNSHSDTVSGGTAHLYRVKASNASGSSSFSNVDLATTVMFTHDPLVPQITTVLAAHISELRTAVGAVLLLGGLSAPTWTDDPLIGGATLIRRVHVEELRESLSEALLALGLPSLSLTDPILTTNTQVKAAHFQELRNAMK